MEWKISGTYLPDKIVEADSFDEAIAKARETDPGYVSGQLVSEYRYGMKYRGFSPGCQPKKGFVRREYGGSTYYDILVYDRPLTGDELVSYELEEVK